jgi:prepilin-type N-terminal cleavage/methylation domain-containing protein
MRKGFTLIEVLIVLVILSFLMAMSVVSFKRFTTSLEYSSSVNQVLSDVKLTQQIACTSSQTCRIEFKAGKNEYSIMKGTCLYRSVTAGKSTRFYGKSYISFAPSGNTDVGGSGTVVLGMQPTAKKIVVSSRGRIRVE